MHEEKITYSNTSTVFYFDALLSGLNRLAPPANCFIITDENILLHYEAVLKPWKMIVVPAGEASKSFPVVKSIIKQLMDFGADRDALIIGIGGGVITDLCGFVAAVYKRGVRCAFVPTSILGMADASIGGKNGLNVDAFKNIIGTIHQPEFLLYDFNLLKSLPQKEWVNGFAEIIKHACILDAGLFEFLRENTISDFQNNAQKLSALIRRNALLKAKVVQEDEPENGIRKILNFGHTLAHAIENTYALPHGHAVAIGMAAAADLSARFTGFKEKEKLTQLFRQYDLPCTFPFDPELALQNMLQDKKKRKGKLDYILLETIGKALIKPLAIEEIKPVINSI